MAGGYVKTTDLPQVVPVFPLDGALLLPRGTLPLNIFEPRYLNMVDDAMAGDRIIGMIQTRLGGDRARPALQAVGCAGRVTSFAETSDGRYLVTLTGVCRFGVGPELPVQTPYRQVKAGFGAFEHDLQPPEDVWDFDRDRLLSALRSYLHQRSMDVDWSTAREAPGEALINSLAMALPFEAPEKQALLQAETLDDRVDALTALLEIEAAMGGDEDPPSVQ